MSEKNDNNGPIAQWLNKALKRIASLKKQALDKLPQEELQGILPGMNSEAPPGMPPQQPPGMPMPPMEVPPPPPEPEPDVSGNVFEVDVNGVLIKMKLMPELVMKDMTPPPSMMPPMPGQPQIDPMSDTSLNPNADPTQLAQWMSDPSTEKPYSTQDKGTVEPLSQEDQGIVPSVNDTGSENELAQNPKVPVHKKQKPKMAAAEPLPGADRSNPEYPCKVCANYDANNNSCIQGIDVEMVQAAGSCSWLNSNFSPFESGSMPNSDKDEEPYKNDISDLPSGNSGAGGGTIRGSFNKNLKDIWKKF